MENQPKEENEINSQNISVKDQFTTVTPFSKYLAMALFVALPFVGFYMGQMFVLPDPTISSEEVHQTSVTDPGEVLEGKDTSQTDSTFEESQVATTATSKLSVVGAIKLIHDKYGYGSGPSYVGLVGELFWFAPPAHNVGCYNYHYILLNSGEEVETKLTACPLVDLNTSYPFHVALCPSSSTTVGESLCVTNLLNLEEKVIQITQNSSETMTSKCVEATNGPYCTVDIQSWGGGLLARIYTSAPREPYAIYENTEFVREIEVDLFDEFDLE